MIRVYFHIVMSHKITSFHYDCLAYEYRLIAYIYYLMEFIFGMSTHKKSRW